MRLNNDFKIYLITPPRIENLDKFFRQFEEALFNGIRFVQFRNKQYTKKEAFSIAVKLREISAQYGSVFIVNDDIDLVLATEADGVHLGKNDFPLDLARKLLGREKIIGSSAHSVNQALEAEQAGANYIGFGSIFPSSNKENIVLTGCDTLKKVRSVISIPIYAIGGISLSTVSSVMKTGANGVAVISAIWNEDSVGKAVQEFNRLILTA